MLLVLLVLGVITFTARAEQVSCKTGPTYCSGSQSLSVINNNHFCCDNGFNMQWKNEVVNDTSLSSCLCNRHFHEVDCIEGQPECLGATSLMSDGVTVKCCKNGDSMNSASNSFVNGVRIDYCKCIRFVNGVNGGIVSVGGGIRPMTDIEATHLTSAMNKLSHDLQTSLGQMTRTLGQNLGLLDPARVLNQVGLGQFNPGNWAANFLEGLGQNIRRTFNQAVDPPVGAATNVLNRVQPVPFTSPRPRPMWDVRQRRFEQLQRRLQRQQGGAGVNFVDRLGRNPTMAQIMSPGMWVNPGYWRRMFGMGPNNTTQTVADIKNTNGGETVASNVYNTQPAQNVNTTA